MWQLNAPAILILPLFAEPRVTSGRTGEDGTMDVYAHHVVVVVDQDAAAEVMRDHHVTQLRVRIKTYGYEFARLLAKIAWGRAAWDFALDALRATDRSTSRCQVRSPTIRQCTPARRFST
jgi:hypothetical protein